MYVKAKDFFLLSSEAQMENTNSDSEVGHQTTLSISSQLKLEPKCRPVDDDCRAARNNPNLN